MREKVKRCIRMGLLLAPVVVISGVPALAQEGGEDTLEEVVVTGSFVRQDDTFTARAPIQALDARDIAAAGTDSIAELVLDLTINNGSETRTSAFDSNGITGTSSFNLRGLGLGSTLTLINGRRMTLSSVTALDGSQFADLNNIPVNVVERVEIVKDGASALYGSDAIAGVANVITRQLDGFEVDLRFQSTFDDQQDDSTVNLGWGAGNETGHVNVFYTYFDRTPLKIGDREFSFGSFQTPLGFPGNFLPVANGAPIGPPAFDPDCENVTGQPFNNFVSPFFTGFDACITDLTTENFDTQEFVATEERHTAYVDGRYAITNGVELKGEYSYSKNDVVRANASSLPLLLNVPFIPSTHPNNPFGVDVIPILIKAIPDGQADGAATFEYETHRAMGGLTAELGNGWSMDTGVVFSETTSHDELDLVLANELQLALLGFGGGNCTPFQGPPGVGDCGYYNIFGSSLTDPAAANSPDMLDFIKDKRIQDKQSELFTADIVISGDLWDMTHGPVGAAFGAQYRKDSLSTLVDQNTLDGNWTFVPPGANFDGERDSYAVFGEMALPLAADVDLSLAVRYEDYGDDGGDTVDPKLGIGWQATESVLLRAGYGTSFRAPTPFHLNATTSDAQAAQPFCGSPQNGAVSRFVSANPILQPEDAASFFVGTAITVGDGFDASIDYWRYDYDDVITLDSVQGIINGACAANPADPGSADSRITSQGSQVIAVTIPFENVGKIETDGIDLAARYVHESATGELGFSATATYVNSYDITQADGQVTEGAGLRNRLNFGRPMPQWRANSRVYWRNHRHSTTLTVYYIDEYTDDADNSEVDSSITVDLRYTLTIDNWLKGVELGLGINNLFNEMPPSASGIGNYDPQVHDPRGRLGYISLKTSF